jgi:hypothetical protein
MSVVLDGRPRADADEQFEERLNHAAVEIIALLMKKRRAYGASNLLRFGPVGIAIRASDKIDRLANMLQDGEAIGGEEGIEDAWMDLIGYGLLGLLDYRERRQ